MYYNKPQEYYDAPWPAFAFLKGSGFRVADWWVLSFWSFFKGGSKSPLLELGFTIVCALGFLFGAFNLGFRV